MAILNPMTVTELDAAIPELWDKKVRIDAARKSFWGKFTGKEGSDQPIIERRDFTQDPGNQINVQIASQLLQEGVTGDTTLRGSEEKYTLAQMTITPNVLRHAVAFNWRAKKQINFNAIQMAGDQLSTWLARRTDEDLFNELLNNNVPTTLFAGSAATRAALGPNDVFGTDEIRRGKLALQRQGALPIRTVLDGKQEIDWYGVVISECDEYNLKLDTVWNNAQQHAGERGDKNRIFAGSLGHYNSVHVYTHAAVRFGGRYGSYLRPEAVITTLLTAGATTLVVGTDSNVSYTKFFPTTGTLLIENEQITYTGKTNTTLTGLTRGANSTTAAQHATGVLVTAKNLGRAIFFGAEIAARVWGLDPTRITNVEDYGFEQGIGIMAYFGQKTVKDSASLFPNALIMETYSPNPNSASGI